MRERNRLPALRWKWTRDAIAARRGGHASRGGAVPFHAMAVVLAHAHADHAHRPPGPLADDPDAQASPPTVVSHVEVRKAVDARLRQRPERARIAAR